MYCHIQTESMEMKNTHPVIYLVIDAGGEEVEDFKKLYPVDWCQDRINKTDLPYVDPVRFLAWIEFNRVKNLGKTFEQISQEYIETINGEWMTKTTPIELKH